MMQAVAAQVVRCLERARAECQALNVDSGAQPYAPPLLSALDPVAAQDVQSAQERETDALMRTYLVNCSHLLSEMGRAATQGDLQRLRYTAHTLANSSRAIGALALAAEGQEREWAQEKTALSMAQTNLVQIMAEQRRLEAMLKAWLGNLDGSSSQPAA